MQSLIQQIWGETWDLHLTSSRWCHCCSAQVTPGGVPCQWVYGKVFPSPPTPLDQWSLNRCWIDGSEKLEGNISVRGHSRTIEMPLTIGSSFEYWIPTMCQALVKTTETSETMWLPLGCLCSKGARAAKGCLELSCYERADSEEKHLTLSGQGRVGGPN